MRVAVVGAGVGGLSAAIALRNRGIDAVVYEQAEEPKALGAGLHLWSNAVRGLREIGLGHITESIAVPIEREQIFTSSGKLLAEWPVGEVGREIGAPSIGLNRPELLRALLDALGADALQLGRRVTGFAESDGAVEVQFADGAAEHCDFLVGADGLSSVTRAELLGASPPRYSGYTSWRTLVEADSQTAPPGQLGQYWGRGVRFVYFPAGKELVYFACLANAPAEGRVSGKEKDELKGRLTGFCEPVSTLVEAAKEDELIRMDVADRDPVSVWGRGRVTLLGDAAHAMTPNTSQGAGMAIEDAAVLARCLDVESPSAESLREYERRRQKRANPEVTRARFPGRLGRLENPLACSARNTFIRLTFGGMVWKQQKKFISADF